MSSYKLKILLCGPAAVGKTSLIQRFVKSSFARDYKLTVGVDILTKDVEYAAGSTATLSIWDIGGQERFSFIRTTFYKGASGVLLVFDLSRSATWDSIKNWRAEVKQFAGDIPFILIGNKKDLIAEVGEVIDTDECQEYAEDEGSIYLETSAKDGTQVDESFVELTRLIVAHKRRQVIFFFLNFQTVACPHESGYQPSPHISSWGSSHTDSKGIQRVQKIIVCCGLSLGVRAGTEHMQ